MKNYPIIACALVLVSLSPVSHGQAAPIATQMHPINVDKFLPAQNKIVSVTYGDTDNNGIEDVIVVSENPNKTNDTRLLQVIRAFPSGQIKVNQNKLLIPCAACGGRSEEPTLRKIKVLKNGFEVQIYWGGIRNGYLKSIEFNYVVSKHDWFVKKQVLTRFDDDHQMDNNYAVTKIRHYSKNAVSFERATQRN